MMLSIRDLTVRYSTETVLDRFSLELEEGDLYAMIGPSGSGKSTLLKVLCGIKADYSGTVEYRGKSLVEGAPRIGYVPQNYGLLDWKTVRKNINIPSELKHGKPINQTLIQETVSALEIGGLMNRFPQELSGGEKQRVALARAFAAEPDLLLMDEPFSALDAFTSAAGQRLFLRLWSEHVVTALFITHNISEAISIGKKIILMDKNSRRVNEVFYNHTFGKGPEADAERMALGARLMKAIEAVA